MKQSLLLFGLALQLLGHAQSPVVSPYFKIDQFGYLPTAQKVAVIARPQTGAGAPGTYTPSATLQVRRHGDHSVAFSATAQAWNSGATHAQSGDKVWWLDFSALSETGVFYVFDPLANLASQPFRIAADAYTLPLRRAVKALYYQRCGTAITAAHGGQWTHSACHQGNGQDTGCRLVSNPSTASAKDLSGGWHDAGDYNKYVNFTYGTLHDLLFAYENNPGVFTDDFDIPESGNGSPDLVDEIRYELEWLLKMQQPDGAVLSKISVTEFQAASPPNLDNASRYYSAASTSATLTVASVFAHAARVLKTVPNQSAFADLLNARAELAWTWAEAHPAVLGSNSGFQSADPEVSDYDRQARKTCAAAFLFALTGKAVYKTYFENQYTALHPYEWSYFYAFESTYGDVLLFYSRLAGISPSVKSNILSRFNNSTNGAADFFPAVAAHTDAYRAYLKDGDYVWGSNLVKARTGLMYLNMNLNLQSPANQAAYQNAALDYLHYLHGVNPPGLAMLSNLQADGIAQAARQIYHGWTGDGTAWDNNPIPGLLTGGMNQYYSGTNAYFNNQPVQKKYLDWNTSWPENSWEITEPAIYYQAGYVRLVSHFATAELSVAVSNPQEKRELEFSVAPNPASQSIQISIAAPGPWQIQLLNLEGRVVLAQLLDDSGWLSLEQVPAGSYLLRVGQANGSGTWGAQVLEVVH
ncbi:MAG: glycoside hydrolase family 9 protein [Saprospiraceae bacterium]|nr:glycoside hydrolase family 9 protein [Saprospiraceae bacterium]